MTFTFRKNERLCSRTLEQQLFQGGKSQQVSVYPVRAVYLEVDHREGDAQVQVLMSVSKRHFKHAVDRNRIKRQLREAYRLNKSLLPAVAEGRQLLIAFIWMVDRHHSSAKVTRSVCRILERIGDSVN